MSMVSTQKFITYIRHASLGGEKLPKRLPAGFRFSHLSQRVLNESPLLQQGGRSNKFAARRQQGHRCYCIMNGQELATYFWASEGSKSFPPLSRGLLLSLPKGTAYIWDCRTAASQQRQGLYAAGLEYLAHHLLGRNEHVVILTHTHNTASQRGISRAGFSPLGRIEVYLFWRIGFIIAHGKAQPIMVPCTLPLSIPKATTHHEDAACQL